MVLEVRVRQFDFVVSDGAFEDSRDRIFFFLFINHLQYQQQNNNGITQFTKSEFSCSSNDNGYSQSTDININDLF